MSLREIQACEGDASRLAEYDMEVAEGWDYLNEVQAAALRIISVSFMEINVVNSR